MIATLIFQGCGTDHFNKFIQTGEPANLQASLRFFDRALSVLRPGQQLHHSSVSNYASGLIARFEQTTDNCDLDLGIKHLEGWLKAQPPDDPTSRRLVLETLAQTRDVKWKTFGEVMDLESMIASEQQALDLCPLGDAEREGCSTRLAAALAQRPQKASPENATAQKVSKDDNNVGSVKGQTSPKKRVVHFAETLTLQATPPTSTSYISAPICVLRPGDEPEGCAWKGKGQQPFAKIDPTPAGSSAAPSFAPPSPPDDESDEASAALARSLMEDDTTTKVSIDVTPLVAMGYTFEQVMTAFFAASFNKELALEYLVEGVPREFQEDAAAEVARMRKQFESSKGSNPFAGPSTPRRSHTASH
ncbi:hypothetical protein FRB97_005810 [Tulasnella sp. 331]|nr:hypothetical protein FRB97_005810 [Tulasnella sp. 331]